MSGSARPSKTEPNRVHDLGALLDNLVDKLPALEDLRDDVSVLAPLAVRFRYPGNWLTAQQAQVGVECSGRIRLAAPRVADTLRRARRRLACAPRIRSDLDRHGLSSGVYLVNPSSDCPAMSKEIYK